MKTKIGMRKNEKQKRENENEKLRKKRETKNENKKRKQTTKMRNGNLPSSFNSFSVLSSVPPNGNAGRESGREKEESGGREKKESRGERRLLLI